jgi:hypothetical protein
MLNTVKAMDSAHDAHAIQAAERVLISPLPRP